MVHWWVLVPSGCIGDSFATKNWKKAKKKRKSALIESTPKIKF
jgi:hypothetical protein